MKSKTAVLVEDFYYTSFSQGLTFLLSLTMTIVLPKILGVLEFGYWQLFLFLISYVGFFHFGLIDGIYLTYAGIEITYEKRQLISIQLKILFFVETLLGLLLVIITLLYTSDDHVTYIITLSVIYLIFSNLSTFLGTILQVCNNVKKYSIAAVIEKAFFLILLVLLFCFKVTNAEYYISCYVSARLIGFVYLLLQGRDFVFVENIGFWIGILEFKRNIIVGSVLMISNIIGMLVIGVSRYFLVENWDITNFSQVSFALTLTSFILLFISQLGVVLYPYVSRINYNEQKRVFAYISDFFSFTLNASYFLFPIIQHITVEWLPQYKGSLSYMIILLPLCFFEGKMQILFNPYMKLLRKERDLLRYNLISLAIVLAFSFISVYYDSIIFLVLSITIVTAIRSIIIELFLSRYFNFGFSKNIFHYVMPFVFVLCMYGCYSDIWGLLFYFLIFSGYLVIMKKDLISAMECIKIFTSKQKKVKPSVHIDWHE